MSDPVTLYVYAPFDATYRGPRYYREATDAEVLAHPAVLALVAERDRLLDVLAAERGERGPEGWYYSYPRDVWEYPNDDAERITRRVGRSWYRDGEHSYLGWWWESRLPDGGARREGHALDTALEAMEAADRAGEGREG